MGTDIHPAVEVRRKGIWRYHTPKTECDYYYERDYKAGGRDPVTGLFPRVLDPATGEPVRSKWDRCKYRLPSYFSNRNYRVFAIVGNVRNGTGFAGVYSHDEIPYIQDNRGWPEDMTKEAFAKFSHDHSEGWVSLTELKAYDYRQVIKESGVLSEAEYLAFLFGGRKRPVSWGGGVSGQKAITVTEADYLKTYESPIDLLQPIEGQQRVRHTVHSTDWLAPGAPIVVPDPTKTTYVQTNWEESMYDEVSDIPEKWVPYLEKLVPKGGSDDDVRVVFDFDS